MIDVLIIGSGGAGLTAAIWAKKNGASVAIYNKNYPTNATTSQAQGGINAVMYDGIDDSSLHIEDTLRSAHKLGNKKTIKYLCENAKEAVSWLDCIGVPFSKTEDGHFAQRKLGASKYQRSCHSSDYTGLKIIHTLRDYAQSLGIEFINEHYLLNLICENEAVVGALFLDIKNGEVKEVGAKSVILATGGFGELYNGFCTNSSANTGDGLAVALRAGAKLGNLEFIQFHPTTLEHSSVLISESARAEGGKLVTNDGERFVDELGPRDEVARAIFAQIQNGKKVFLDMRHLGLAKIMEEMPQERALAYEFEGLKMEDEPICIKPSAHYTMGGIKVDENCQTSLKNLFACGECADAGIHGANRLGGNSLAEIIVFGKLAGTNAAKNALNSEIFNLNDEAIEKEKNKIKQIIETKSECNFYDNKELMGKIFYDDVGLFRDEPKLLIALEFVRKCKVDHSRCAIADKSTKYNKNLVEYLEFENMLELAEAVVLSAIARKESRGAHYRVDFPNETQNFDANSIVCKKDDFLEIVFEKVEK